MEDEKYVSKEIYGMIFVQGESYFLLSPFPLKKDDWMGDNMEMFDVAVEFGVPHTIVIRGDFLISYLKDGETIKLRANTQKGD